MNAAYALLGYVLGVFFTYLFVVKPLKLRNLELAGEVARLIASEADSRREQFRLATGDRLRQAFDSYGTPKGGMYDDLTKMWWPESGVAEPPQSPVTIRDMEADPDPSRWGMDHHMSDPCPKCGAFRMTTGSYACIGACMVCWEKAIEEGKRDDV